MGAVLCIAKDLRFVSATDGDRPRGARRVTPRCDQHVVVIDIGTQGAGNVFAGDRARLWPFYPDIEVESDLPLNDIRDRCAQLRGDPRSVRRDRPPR